MPRHDLEEDDYTPDAHEDEDYGRPVRASRPAPAPQSTLLSDADALRAQLHLAHLPDLWAPSVAAYAHARSDALAALKADFEYGEQHAHTALALALTGWAASRLTAVVQEDIIRQVRQVEEAERRRRDDMERARIASLEKQSLEERAEKKKEAAKEGWRKRRAAQEAKQKQAEASREHKLKNLEVDRAKRKAQKEAQHRAAQEAAIARAQAIARGEMPDDDADDALALGPRRPRASAVKAANLLAENTDATDARPHDNDDSAFSPVSASGFVPNGLGSPAFQPDMLDFNHDEDMDIDFALDDDADAGYSGLGQPAGKRAYNKKPKTPEEAEKAAWAHIARNQIPKVFKRISQSTSSRQLFARRISGLVTREAKKVINRTRPPKDTQLRAKRVMREMLIFLKANEKREREGRKKAEKEALEKLRKEEELRDMKRQANKLNFLITQTELYSHFVGNKIKTNEAEESTDTTASTNGKSAPPVPAALANLPQVPPEGELADIDFDADDDSVMNAHAARNAQAAIQAAKDKAAAFDAVAAAELKAAQEKDGVAPTSPSKSPSKPLNFDSDELNFQNPTSMGEVSVKQPKMLTCELKEYQLKGLNWLANLYEQGINGILADEMGLGKTVQSISLMAYLAEHHNIWGPFLVIAPASTLHNWQQEITRFAPNLKVLPYWGNVKDRTTLRKFWNRKSIRYDKDAPFHVLVTSYQLVVTDEQYFQKVKWQYMVLDEAQAIKSSQSARWKTLLGFQCRNRLLLTGTPIQNSMQELWALLHFIMPSLFDSHDEFSSWFSKDIEGNAEGKGAMNEHQLRRLHMILKPFMLRRIKRNVQNELAEKIELDVMCDLTPRQRMMYRTLRQNISVADLVQRASTLGDDDSVKRLMNLIMQFRKVCNHPELFERADVTSPFSMVTYYQPFNLQREGFTVDVHYATHSTIPYSIPRTVYQESLQKSQDTKNVQRLMDIWNTKHLHQSQTMKGIAPLVDKTPSELVTMVKGQPLDRVSLSHKRSRSVFEEQEFQLPPSKGLKEKPIPHDPTWRSLGLAPLNDISNTFAATSRLARPDLRFHIPSAVAPPIEVDCSDRRYATHQSSLSFDLDLRTAVYGLSSSALDSLEDTAAFSDKFPSLSPAGFIGSLPQNQLPVSPFSVPQLEQLILDSGKLAKLDELLVQLKAGGHRVLLYFQMTRMIDLMEEYLAFRQYKYLRLDGSSSISERRDMVGDWQTKPELFIFLLSTRAGGLGINLTAADTVIFYDCDWNPSNDAQAMDRAHRLGQKRQVTVYRLITQNTIDERIVKLARQKKNVQDAVVGSSSHVAVDTSAKPNEVVSLLLDEEEMAESVRQAEARRAVAVLKMSEDGKKGAKVRAENRQAREAAALLAPTSGFGAWAGNDDDDDAFAFFTAGNASKGDMEDEEVVGASKTATSAKKAPPKPRKKPVQELGPDGEPVKKKRKKPEPKLDENGVPIPPKKRAPKKKKEEAPPPPPAADSSAVA